MNLSLLSLVACSSLVFIAIAISYKEKLELESDLLIAVIRMIIQLSLVGFVLTYIFEWDKAWITLIIVLIMDLNAAHNAGQRGKHIPGSFRISLIVILGSSLLAMAILLLTGSIRFIPEHVIPINGMMIGNGMAIIGLSFKNLSNSISAQQKQITEKLALGATKKQASMDVIRESIKISLQPTIDSTRTVGLVTLPGMMTGMIFSGVMPMNAIMYQIMIYFMIIAIATICAVGATYMAYPSFYNEKGQLLVK